MSDNLDIFAAIVGGLGKDQTTDIVVAARNIPGVRAWSPGETRQYWDAYKAHVPFAVRVRPSRKIALLGHSFGGRAVIDACNELATYDIRVDYLGLIDPVDYAWGDLVLPAGDAAPLEYDWFRRESYYGPRTANIAGSDAAHTRIIPGTDHNSICHHPDLIAAVVARLNALRATEARP